MRRPHRPRLRRTLTWPVSLLVTTRSSTPLPVVSTAWTSETPRPTGRMNAAVKIGGASVLAGPTDPLRDRLPKYTESVPSPALRTTRSSRPPPLSWAAMICAGNGRSGAIRRPDETAVAVGVKPDGVVLGVEAGEYRTLSRYSAARRCRARGKPGLTSRAASKAAGLAGDALAIEDIPGAVDDQDIGGAIAIDVGHQRRGLRGGGKLGRGR